MSEKPIDRGQIILDVIYDDVDRRLNPDGDECWNCGGEGETYDCIDGCCEGAESGCPDCARPCLECRLFTARRAKAVRMEVVEMGDVDVAVAWLKGTGRWRDGITPDQVREQIENARAKLANPSPSGETDTKGGCMMPRPSKNNSWCRHRTAFDAKEFPVCAAGVDYHAFPKPWYGPDGVMPCLGETPEARSRCDRYSGFTAEEIAAADAELTARFARIGTIREAIMAAHKATGSNGGHIFCPACKTGTVSWSRARSNGHVLARCSTPKCASWME